MAQIFPEWTNRLPGLIVAGVTVTGIAVIGFIWYFFSPEYTDAGYMPDQPVEYSHKWHAGDEGIGLDCRYCHTSVEISSVAAIPPTRTCMNCHTDILPKSEKLQPVRDSFEKSVPLAWNRVHNLPDYAYFNHSVHIRSGVGCASCHGQVNEMVKVMQKKPLSMGWCLECHRDPAPYIRPVEEVTNMTWVQPENHLAAAEAFIKSRNISPPEDCSGCHR